MTSGFKSTETQLVAIHKLEFYKNKKNWKLYEDVKKETPRPPAPKATTQLDKTYSIKEEVPEQEYDVEQVSAHNKAFLHEELDDAPDPQPPDDMPPSLPAPRPRSSLELAWSGDKTETDWEDPQKDWCGAEAEGTRDELAYDQCDGACPQDSPWSPATQFELHAECLTPAQTRQAAEDWLAQHGCQARQRECEDYGPEDESAEFVRGAHCAPHSSEVDLSIARECPCTYNKSLCVLSVRQLSRAIQRHHSALTLLLREQTLRERLHPPIPFEEYPTRDTDPLWPPDSVLSGSHSVLSGSHRLLSAPGHDAGTGRGRGRLQQRGIIGIGMGRPYRL